MKAYRILINAQNIQTKFDGEFGQYGFYTTRFVMANDRKEAILTATELIRNEDNFKAIQLNKADDPPRFLIEEIEEIDPSQVPQKQITGYSLYAEEDYTIQ
jgi:hypothetical protein